MNFLITMTILYIKITILPNRHELSDGEYTFAIKLEKKEIILIVPTEYSFLTT